MAQLRLENAVKELLAELYRETRLTVDELPYTDEFERLYAAFIVRSGLTMTRHDVWKALAGCRKQSRLTRKERPLT
jgi:hypothetical protein